MHAFPPALAELLDGIGGDPKAGSQRYFNPGPDDPAERRAPPEFLEWLAGWVAVSQREDLTDDENRRFISQILPLYRLLEMELISNVPADVAEQDAWEIFYRRRRIATAIIDREKPAHTYYGFRGLDPPDIRSGAGTD
jgi:hypothetical protein